MNRGGKGRSGAGLRATSPSQPRIRVSGRGCGRGQLLVRVFALLTHANPVLPSPNSFIISPAATPPLSPASDLIASTSAQPNKISMPLHRSKCVSVRRRRQGNISCSGVRVCGSEHGVGKEEGRLVLTVQSVLPPQFMSPLLCFIHTSECWV
jgi:hypothetical protein